jgi:LmbE family N-acetylglucosaminyl deacetylase
MIQLRFERPAERPLDVLCLGCHADDIEIGCGGTILRIAKELGRCRFHWVVCSASGVREAEARRSAELFAQGGQLEGPFLKGFPDGFMPFVGGDVKAMFEDLKRTVAPDVIFTHNRDDAHQDHRLIAELTWNTFRDHFILEYEIPKYDGDMGRPTVFVPLDSETSTTKVRYLMECFPSQHSHRWFDEATFFALMRLRGMECNAASGYAEAFFCRKLSL